MFGEVLVEKSFKNGCDHEWWGAFGLRAADWDLPKSTAIRDRSPRRRTTQQ